MRKIDLTPHGARIDSFQRGARLVVGAVLALLLLLQLTGCASMEPGRMFPREQSSRVAESVWLGLHTVDTMQTVQIARNPQCFWEDNKVAAAIYGTKHPDDDRVMLTNVLLGFVHSRVSRWFDDGVDRSFSAEDGNEGLWYVGRIAWHAVSIGASAAAVSNNYRRGIGPTGTGCR